eukprot:maker-scaffold_7-snap-gene-4.9-mRNA-1 protein AED:0.00 eAED:0.00 QI:236/1/1/1/1/1/2/124/418
MSPPKGKNPLQYLSLFSHFHEDLLAKLELLFTMKDLPGGSTVYKHGERAAAMYIVITGKVVMTLEDELLEAVELTRLSNMGSIFGDEAILVDPKAVYDCTATCLEDCMLLKLARSNLDKFINLTGDLGRQMQRVAFEKFSAKDLFRKMHLFDGVSRQKIYLLGLLSKFVTYREGDLIFEKGKIGANQGFHVLTRGKLEVLYEGKVLKQCNPGTYFGEVSLVTSKPPGVTLRASSDCSCVVVQKNDFRALFADERSVLSEFAIKVFGSKIDFSTFRRHPAGRESFTEFCREEFSAENIEFLTQVENLEDYAKRKTKTDVLRALKINIAQLREKKSIYIRSQCKSICENFVLSNSEREISMSAATRTDLIAAYKTRNFHPEMFGEAKELLVDIMENDSFERYKSSDQFKALLKELGTYFQ